jgi:hypothetical protein
MVLALAQNHSMTKKEKNAKVALEMRQHVAFWQNGKMSSRQYIGKPGHRPHTFF